MPRLAAAVGARILWGSTSALPSPSAVAWRLWRDKPGEGESSAAASKKHATGFAGRSFATPELCARSSFSLGEKVRMRAIPEEFCRTPASRPGRGNVLLRARNLSLIRARSSLNERSEQVDPFALCTDRRVSGRHFYGGAPLRTDLAAAVQRGEFDGLFRRENRAARPSHHQFWNSDGPAGGQNPGLLRF